MPAYFIISFYRFVNVKNVDSLKIELLEFCNKCKIKGTIILAEEGINATLAGSNEAIKKFCDFPRVMRFFPILTLRKAFQIYLLSKK